MKKDRILVVDWMKAFCIILVIFNHSDLFDRTTNVFFLMVIDIAVPVFMILSGYTFALRYNKSNIKEMFDGRDLERRFLRFTIPMLMTFSVYQVYTIAKGDFSVFSAIKSLIIGGYGQGSYYYSMMLEFMFVAPFILVIIRTKRLKGIILIAAVNLLYEIICHIIGLSGSLYRIIVFRYLVMIACGMNAYYMIEEKEMIYLTNKRKAFLLIGFGLGALYKIAPCLGYSYHLFTYSPWGRTSMLSALYVFPIAYALLSLLRNTTLESFKMGGGIAEIGKASYHIMYAQMFYYVLRSGFDKLIFDLGVLGKVPELILNVVVCVTLGVVFWWFDQRYITGKMIRALKSAQITYFR